MQFLKVKNIENYRLALFSGYAYTLLSLFTSIFVTRHIFKYFDNSAYGIFILVVETIAIFELVDFGFSGGMISFLSRETTDVIRINKLVSTLFYAQLILAFVAGIGALGLYWKPEWLFQNTQAEPATLKMAIVMSAISLFLTMVTKSLSQILYARRKAASDNFLKIFALLLRVVLIFTLLQYYPTIEFLIGVTLATQVINLLQTIWQIRKLEKDISFAIHYFDWQILQEVFAVSGWFAIGAIAIVLIERFDNIMTGRIISAQAITLLVITRKLFDIAKTFIFQLNNNYRPFFGKLFGEGKVNEAQSKFNNISLLSVLIAAIVGGGLIIINEIFISKWVGIQKFGGNFLGLLLFFNLVFHSWKITYRAYLSSNLIAKELAISSFIEGLLNVIGAYFLGLRYGIEGIVASTFITGFAVQLISLFYILRKHQLDHMGAFMRRNLIQLILIVIMGLLAYGITLHMPWLVLRVLTWIALSLISLVIIHRLLLRQYSFVTVLKGKIV